MLNQSKLIGQFEVLAPYKGTREYVQSATLIDACIKHFDLAKLDKAKFSMHGFINTPHCLLSVRDKKPQQSTLQAAPFRGQFWLNGLEYWVTISANEIVNSIVDAVPYNESDISNSCTPDGNQITLEKQVNYSLTEILVSMNKKLLQTRYPSEEKKWIFATMEYTIFPSNYQKITLCINHNFQNKLIKSCITIDGVDVGFICFSTV